jgi:hypothetical protein
MPEPLGPFTVIAEGILRPAQGIVQVGVGPPPVYDVGQAVGLPSRITTAHDCADAAAALAEAQAYRDIVGTVVTFRGVPVFVADVQPDHKAERNGQEGVVTAVWTLVAPMSWVP